MPVSTQYFADFLLSMGHTVREANGVFWFNTHLGVYSSFPYHCDVDAYKVDLSAILGSDGMVARFGCPVEQGVESFRIICDDLNYDLPILKNRTRTQVRRGLEACRIEQVDFELLRKHAIPLNADTLIRQGRKVPSDLEAYWTRYYENAARTEGAETWAAFVGDQLAAYLISFTMQDVANILILRSSPKFLNAFPGNAMVFRYLHDRMRSGEIRQVCCGYESIQADSESLDQFKTSMGFRKVPVGQRIELAGWLKPLVNKSTTPMAGRILKAIGKSDKSVRLQSILKWYQQQPSLQPQRGAVRAA